MTVTPMTIFWLVVVGAAVVGFVVLMSRAVKSGKDPGVPTTVQSDTQDAPPPSSDAAILEERRRADDSPADRETDEWVDIRRTHGG